MINAGRRQGDGPSNQEDGPSDQEAAARWDRIVRRVAQASNREGTGHAGLLRLEITEALLIAQDLYMLGEIPEAPSLRWDIATTEAALSRWGVRVVPDGTLTWNRRPPRATARCRPDTPGQSKPAPPWHRPS